MGFDLRKYCEAMFLEWLLPKLLTKKCCNSEISKSGEEARKVNCCFIYIRNKDGELWHLVKGINIEKREIYVDSINPKTKYYSVPETLFLPDILTKHISVRYYYKGLTILYNSLYSLIFKYLTKYDLARFEAQLLWDWLLQSLFNKRKLKTLNRIELLAFLEKDLKNWDNSQSSGISTFDLMTRIYTPRWGRHPDAEKQDQELEMHLESLVLSGDLEKDNQGYRYIVTPKALMTLEKDKEEKRRHQDTLKIGKINLWIGSIMAIGTIITALSMLWK